MKSEYIIITTKRCKKCRWSTAYHNWSPIGSPKVPDTWYCMDERITEVKDDCSAYSEPEEEDNEEEV